MPPRSWIPSMRLTSLPGHGPKRAPAGTIGSSRTALPGQQSSDGPGVELEGARPPGGEGGVEDVQRVERLDPVDEVFLAEAVQGPHREPAGVDRRPLLQEGLDLPVPGQV